MSVARIGLTEGDPSDEGIRGEGVLVEGQALEDEVIEEPVIIKAGFSFKLCDNALFRDHVVVAASETRPKQLVLENDSFSVNPPPKSYEKKPVNPLTAVALESRSIQVCLGSSVLKGTNGDGFHPDSEVILKQVEEKIKDTQLKNGFHDQFLTDCSEVTKMLEDSKFFSEKVLNDPTSTTIKATRNGLSKQNSFTSIKSLMGNKQGSVGEDLDTHLSGKTAKKYPAPQPPLSRSISSSVVTSNSRRHTIDSPKNKGIENIHISSKGLPVSQTTSTDASRRRLSRSGSFKKYPAPSPPGFQRSSSKQELNRESSLTRSGNSAYIERRITESPVKVRANGVNYTSSSRDGNSFRRRESPLRNSNNFNSKSQNNAGSIRNSDTLTNGHTSSMISKKKTDYLNGNTSMGNHTLPKSKSDKTTELKKETIKNACPKSAEISNSPPCDLKNEITDSNPSMEIDSSLNDITVLNKGLQKNNTFGGAPDESINDKMQKESDKQIENKAKNDKQINGTLEEEKNGSNVNSSVDKTDKNSSSSTKSQKPYNKRTKSGKFSALANKFECEEKLNSAPKRMAPKQPINKINKLSNITSKFEQEKASSTVSKDSSKNTEDNTAKASVKVNEAKKASIGGVDIGKFGSVAKPSDFLQLKKSKSSLKSSSETLASETTLVNGYVEADQKVNDVKKEESQKNGTSETSEIEKNNNKKDIDKKNDDAKENEKCIARKEKSLGPNSKSKNNLSKTSKNNSAKGDVTTTESNEIKDAKSSVSKISSTESNQCTSSITESSAVVTDSIANAAIVPKDEISYSNTAGAVTTSSEESKTNIQGDIEHKNLSLNNVNRKDETCSIENVEKNSNSKDLNASDSLDIINHEEDYIKGIKAALLQKSQIKALNNNSSFSSTDQNFETLAAQITSVQVNRALSPSATRLEFNYGLLSGCSNRNSRQSPMMYLEDDPEVTYDLLRTRLTPQSAEVIRFHTTRHNELMERVRGSYRRRSSKGSPTPERTITASEILKDAEERLAKAIRSPLSRSRTSIEKEESFPTSPDPSQMDILMPLPTAEDLSAFDTSSRSHTPLDFAHERSPTPAPYKKVVEETESMLSETDILLRKSRSLGSLRRSFTRSLSGANINRLAEVTADLAEQHSTAHLAGERLEAEQAERMRLEKEVSQLQNDVKLMTNTNDKLEMERLALRNEVLQHAELNGHIEEFEEGADASLYKRKYDWSLKEIDILKKQLKQQQEDDYDQLSLLRKQLEKKVFDANEESDEQRQIVSQLKKKSQRLQAEMNDLKILLEEQTSRNNLLEKKQRKFDQDMQGLHEELKNERSLKEKCQRERDQILSEKYSFEQEVSTLKLELDLKDEKVAALKRELDDLSFTGKVEEETALLKKTKHDLELRLKDQEEELDDMAGQVQMLEAAKIRLEMSIEQMRKENRKEAQQRDDEFEEIRLSSQKRLKAMEMQLEAEHDERTQLVREKHELERRLADANDRTVGSVDEEYVHRLKKELKKSKALLKDTQTMLEKTQSEGSNKLILRQLKTQLEDAEFAKTAALKARQCAESDVVEIQTHLDETIRAKKDAEDRYSRLLKEKAEMQTQLEEGEEELAEVMKKYKATVSQLSVDQITISEQTQFITELEQDKQTLQEKLSELSSKVEVLEGETANIHTQKRLQMKIKELESKLELEQTTRQRLDNQISRLRDQIDRLVSDCDATRMKETQAVDNSKKILRQMRESKEELGVIQQRYTEVNNRKEELEKQLELSESEIITLKSDLKLAFKRIEDLQQALQGEISDSDSDISDSGSDSESSLSSYLTASLKYQRSSSNSTLRTPPSEAPSDSKDDLCGKVNSERSMSVISEDFEEDSHRDFSRESYA